VKTIIQRTYALRRFWLILCLGGLLTACGSLFAAPATVRQQPVDGLTIMMESPEQIRINQSQNVVITLRDSQGAPVESDLVYLDLVMPEHSMGLNQPIADPAGDGVYRVTVVYNMLGDWTTSIVATVDGQEHRATFTTQVIE
jgi:hypothetical protein